MRTSHLLFILSIILISACDKGLSPDLAEEKSGFGGTITFKGEWNPDVNQTHVVVFEDPLLSISDFNVFNLKFVSETIPNGSQSYHYTTSDENSLISTVEPGVISYIAVAQSIKDTITLNREDWYIIGLYTTNNNITEPGTLILPEATILDNINIHCDFNNPPPQPPGGVTDLENINTLIKQKHSFSKTK